MSKEVCLVGVGYIGPHTAGLLVNQVYRVHVKPEVVTIKGFGKSQTLPAALLSKVLLK